jgi:hypothetical protein
LYHCRHNHNTVRCHRKVEQESNPADASQTPHVQDFEHIGGKNDWKSGPYERNFIHYFCS